MLAFEHNRGFNSALSLRKNIKPSQPKHARKFKKCLHGTLSTFSQVEPTRISIVAGQNAQAIQHMNELNLRYAF